MSTRRNETDLAVQSLRLAQRTAPATPPTGNVFAYAKTDGKVYVKDDTGLETALGGSGSDPWTVLKLTADLSNSTIAAVDVTGLGFAPAANGLYLVEAYLPSLSAATTTGIQYALAGPSTGVTYSVVTIRQPMTSSTEQQLHGGLNTFNAAGTALTSVALTRISALVSVGASPGVGNIRVQVKSEVALSAVTVKAGAVLMYRAI